MILELAAPASLPLGLVQHQNQPALLTLTVQHPPVHLTIQAGAPLHVTGPRAHIAHAHAQHYLEHHHLPHTGEIEIELAIPAFMGLSGDTMLGLTIAQALAWAHAQDDRTVHAAATALGLGREHAAQLWGYDQGGLLLTGTQAPHGELPPVLRRAEIAHPERDAWAFVFHFPSPPDETPDTLEDDRLRTLIEQTAYPPEPVTDALFAAVDADDIAAFGRGLMSVQEYFPQSIAPESQRVLDMMVENGAYAWGQMLTGYGLWGLVKGGDASRVLRKKLSDHVGFFGGRVMATITDNRGASSVEKQGVLVRSDPMRPRPGVS